MLKTYVRLNLSNVLREPYLLFIKFFSVTKVRLLALNKDVLTVLTALSQWRAGGGTRRYSVVRILFTSYMVVL